ncbi:MAG TPA: iron-containing redox enzyme family protein [Gaiellales bacterium]|nr:iron-containing redox enzyme family protein [Gaiellales bacterium]
MAEAPPAVAQRPAVAERVAAPRLPAPRGPLSSAVVATLAGPPGPLSLPRPNVADPLADDDLQLALYVCYELHYRSFAGVDERWEWDPRLLAVVAQLETVFEAALRRSVAVAAVAPDAVEAELRRIVADDDGPPLSRRLQRGANLDQFREFMIHRSAYQLKEADPHSWAVPRLAGRPKEALVEVQADEYGGGRPGRMHASLFAASMRAVGLDDTYGAYLDAIPGTTLATVNLMSLLGLHRRLRGGIVGHLAVFEITSPEPNRRYGDGLRRLGFDRAATEFFDEHVEADAVHEAVAAHDLAQGLAVAEPGLVPDILFGAAALLHLEARFAGHLLDRWAAGASSLRRC